jgi:hypothetical protein
MLSYFNAPTYYWIDGALFHNFYYHYNKIKRNSVHRATYFLSLDQRSNSVINNVLLDLILSNISGLSVYILRSPVVGPDKYHPPLLPDFTLILDCHVVSLTSHRSCTQGDYLLLTSYVVLTGLAF